MSDELVVIARLADFCRYHGRDPHAPRDPWSFMREKLLELEIPLVRIKTRTLERARKALLADLDAEAVPEARLVEHRQAFENILSRGDYADLAIHLGPGAGRARAEWVAGLLKNMKAHHLFAEERKPENERDPAWNKLIAELRSRLGIDVLERLMIRPRGKRGRRPRVLRRLRRNVNEYCSVVRIPTAENETFTPFMLPRIEAVIAASLRFLNKYR